MTNAFNINWIIPAHKIDIPITCKVNWLFKTANTIKDKLKRIGVAATTLKYFFEFCIAPKKATIEINKIYGKTNLRNPTASSNFWSLAENPGAKVLTKNWGKISTTNTNKTREINKMVKTWLRNLFVFALA